MPLTAKEQAELNNLQDVFGAESQLPLHARPGPAQPVFEGGGVRSEPLPEEDVVFESPNLSKVENLELQTLENRFEEVRRPTLPPREFEGAVDEFVRALGRGTLNVGSGLLSSLAEVTGESIFDAELFDEWADKAREIAKKPHFQPGTDGGVRGFVANAVGEALPFMAGTIAATLTTGPVGGFAVAYAVEGKAAYHDALDAGASQEKAEIEGFVVGSINAALEMLQIESVLKFAKAGKGSIVEIAKSAKRKALKKVLASGKKLGKEALKLSITEGVQEALQETTSVLAPALTGRELPTIEEAAKRIGQSALGGAVAGPILGGAGGGIQAITSSKDFAEKKTLSRKDAKELFGVDKSTAEARTELLRQAKEGEEIVVHEMPDGTTMPGPEHEGAVTGSQRVVVPAREAEAAVAPEAEIAAPAVAQELETVPEKPAEKKKGRKTVQESELETLLAEEKAAQKAVEGPVPTLEEFKKANPGPLAFVDHQALVRESVDKGIIPYEGWEKDYKDLADAFEQHRAVQKFRGKVVPPLKKAVEAVPEPSPAAPVAKVKKKGRKIPKKAVAEKPAAKKVVEKFAPEDTSDEAKLFDALHSFENADKRWAEARKAGLTDDELKATISSEFGISGGSTLHGGQQHTGGKNPRISVSHTDKPFLKGQKLVDATRKLMGIPEPKPAKPKKKGKKVTKKKEREVTDEPESITEPATSPAVEQRQAGEAVREPTGKLDPTKEKEALEIIERHGDFIAGERGRTAVGGIFTTVWDTEKKEFVVSEVEYTAKQVDAAYRTIQKPVVSPMPDTALFAMPGKEKEVLAIAEKMRKMKPQKRGKRKTARRPTKPTPLPRAKVKQEDHIKAVHQAAAAESTRFAINGVFVDGDMLVATDGRRLFAAEGKWGKDGIYMDKASLRKGSLGKVFKQTKKQIEEDGELKFPKWRDIVPFVGKRREGAIEVGNLQEIWQRVRQAMLLTSEESRGVVILANEDGSLGFSAAAPEVGVAEINIHPGAKVLGGLNPRFLLESIAFHATRGDTFFDFYFPSHDRPVLTKSSDGKTFTVMMPITVDLEAAQKAAPTGFGSRNTVVTTEDLEKLKAEEKEAKPLRGKRSKGLRKGSARIFTAADIARAVKFATFYFEGGIREIGPLTAKLVEIMGDAVKPHMKKAFAEAKRIVGEAEVVAKEIATKPVVAKEKVVDVPQAKKVKTTSVIAKQMKDTLADQGIELGVTYDPISIEEEVEKAETLVASNPAEAKRIAYSDVKAQDLLNNAVRLAYFNKQIADSNYEEAARIANWIRAENTRLGQEIVVNKGFVDDTSPMKFIKQLVTAKMETVGKRFGRGKKGSGVKKASTRIKQEVAKVKEKTEAVRMNLKNAQDFIETLRC